MLFLVVFSSLVYSTVGADLQGALNDVWDFTESYLLSVWQGRFYVYTTAAVLIGVWFIVNTLFKKTKTVNPVNPWPYKSAKKQEHSPVTEKVIHVSGVKVFYGSQTGTAKGFAKELAEDVSTQGIQCEVIDVKDYDPDDRLAEEEELMEPSSDAESSADEEKSHGSVIDMEDLGNVMNRMKKAKLPHEIISEILKEVVLATGHSAYLTLSLVCRWFRDVVTNEIFQKAAHFAWLDSVVNWKKNVSTVMSFDVSTASGNAWSFSSPIHQGTGEEEDEGNCWAFTPKIFVEDFAHRTFFFFCCWK